MGLGGSFIGVDRQQAGGREGVCRVVYVEGRLPVVQYTAGQTLVCDARRHVGGWLDKVAPRVSPQWQSPGCVMGCPSGGLRVAGSSGSAAVHSGATVAPTVSTQTEVVRVVHVWCEVRRSATCLSFPPQATHFFG